MTGDRTVLVTGANSGIGLATVLQLSRQGFRAVGTVRSPEKADVVAKAAADSGVRTETVMLDVKDAAACERVVDHIRPWGLVNNAGYAVMGSIEDVTDDDAHDAFETMVFGPMRLARHALPHMREQGGGRIVNVSSIYGRTTTPLTGWYQGAKHALEALSDALRMEVARDGIRVMIVEPGGFKTSIWNEFERDLEQREGTRYGDAYKRTLSTTRMWEPLMGDPVRVAHTVSTALTSRFTRPRYLVGYDAQALAVWSALTPTQVKDRIVRLVMSL